MVLSMKTARSSGLACFKKCPAQCWSRRAAPRCMAQHKSEEGLGRMQRAAGLGLAAIILSAQPQIAVAVSLPGTTQGDLLTDLLEKNGKGIKILKAPKKAEPTVRPSFVPESKAAAQKPKPAPKLVSRPAPSKKPEAVKKAEALASSVLKFAEPVKTSTTGILPEGLSLPTPKGIQQAAAKAGKEAQQAVEAAVSSVSPAKPAKAIGVQIRNPIAPITAAAGAAAASLFGAFPSVPAAPSLGGVLPSGSQNAAEAIGVAAAELVGAAIATGVVGTITAKVPSKKELKV